MYDTDAVLCHGLSKERLLKKRTHTERMKKRLSVRNEKQREEEKENEREKEKGRRKQKRDIRRAKEGT